MIHYMAKSICLRRNHQYSELNARYDIIIIGDLY